MSIRFFLILAACLSFSPRAWAQTYYNRDVVTNKVVIADTFINDGYFEVQNFGGLTNLTSGQIFDVTLTPYDMTGTKTYINNGTFRALSVRFDTVDDYGYRTPADLFENSPGATMDFADGFHYANFTYPLFDDLVAWYAPVSVISVDAVNIRNQGLMRIGAGGVIELGKTNEVTGAYNAQTIDISDGILAVDPIGNDYGVPRLVTFWDQLISVGGTNYVNEQGIYDFLWGQGTQTNHDLTIFYDGQTVITPEFTVTDQYGARLTTQLFLNNPQTFGYQFIINPTNIVFETVFVATADTNVTVDVSWYPGQYYANGNAIRLNAPYSPVVKLSSVTTNALTLQLEESSVYIMDQLGGSTNNQIIANDRYQFFARPNNYFVTRGHPLEFDSGFAPNLTVDPALFYNTAWSNQIVTNFYAGYDFRMENFVYHPPGVPGVSVHDLPGRIEINGANVDLTRTGIRAEGLISVETDQLVSTTNLVVDASNLAYSLGFTPPAGLPATTPLRIKNLAKDRVARFEGEFFMWSGLWTNTTGIIVTSATATNTNQINLIFHSLVIDATTLNSVQPVSVADFRTKAAHVRIDDNMVVSNRFQLTNALDVTLAGSLELRNLPLNQANFPNAINITNESTAQILAPGLSEFGTTAKPLTNFVNQGAIFSYSQSIVADNVNLSGRIESGQQEFLLTVGFFGGFVYTNFFVPDSGPIYINSRVSGRLNNASVTTYGQVQLSGPVYKLDHSTIAAGSALNFNLASSDPTKLPVLQDTGFGSANLLAVSNSITLLNPTIGSLLGTTIDALPTIRDTFRMAWGVPLDAGAAALTNIPTTATYAAATNAAWAEYAKNVGIGVLRLHSSTNTGFEFRPSGSARAMFVDLLEIDGPGITNLVSLTNQIRVLSGIDIYFADAVSTNLEKNLNLGLQNPTEFRTLAELLNGKKLGNATLHWVPGFNGPNSSVDVVVNGTSVKMNRSLRQSRIIDMDGDGIANAYDDLPMENKPGPIKVVNYTMGQADGKVSVTFQAFTGKYALEYSDSLETPSWKQASTYTQTSTTASNQTLSDPATARPGKRFYRLVFYP